MRNFASKIVESRIWKFRALNCSNFLTTFIYVWPKTPADNIEIPYILKIYKSKAMIF